MTLIAVYGTHPDEIDALRFGQSLAANPPTNVVPIPANERGIEQELRITPGGINMAGAYSHPGGLSSPIYEVRQAARVKARIESINPTAVVDIHGIRGGEFHALVNPDMGVSPTVLGMFKQLGIKYVIMTDCNVFSHFRNAFGLEVTPETDFEFLRRCLEDLANNQDTPTADVREFRWFKDTEVGGLHESIIHPNDLTDAEAEEYGSFKPLPHRIQQRLGVNHTLYPQSNLGQPNEQGFYADLFEDADNPDTSNWPR